MLATLLVLTIPVLWLADPLRSQGPENFPAKLADYRAYLKAVEYDGLSQYAYVVSELQPVWSSTPRSALLGRSAMLAGRAYLELAQPTEAVALLKKYASDVPGAEGAMLLAKALEGAGDAPRAAASYQHVFYEYPLSTEAAEAEAALARLRTELAEAYPPPMPQAMLRRAAELMRGGQAAQAAREYEHIAATAAGRDRDLARVRAATGNARTLAAMTVASPDADAERLYLLHAAFRRADDETRAVEVVHEIGRKYPASTWRMEALVSLGNMYLLTNNSAAYEPFYRACYESFPLQGRASYCHWKVAWSHYRNRVSDGQAMLAEHVSKYPASDKRSAAMYFLGRYADVVTSYPLSYYSVLAREKLGRNVPAAPGVPGPDFQPSAALQARIERAGLLETAGYPDWAEFELKYAAANDGPPFAAALVVAEVSARRGAHDQAIRYIKSFAKGYLSFPIEAAPERFWRVAFPLPYRATLEAYSRARSMDAYVVAALIRQESEFNPRAVSRARAYGLTQVLPSTGRQLSRAAGVSRFTPAMLFEPETNLKIGTLYLKSLLDQHEGRWETALAAYNAGKSRVDRWLTWGEYREPAEFIETIPFTETRDYVQIVLRNADIYRRLYGGSRSASSAAR
jgi:soluble lytic murein transglycosylase